MQRLMTSRSQYKVPHGASVAHVAKAPVTRRGYQRQERQGAVRGAADKDFWSTAADNI